MIKKLFVLLGWLAGLLFLAAACWLLGIYLDWPMWRWPLVFWVAALVAIVAAHVRPAAYARFVDSRLTINLAVIGSLLVSLVVLRVVSRSRAGSVK